MPGPGLSRVWDVCLEALPGPSMPGTESLGAYAGVWGGHHCFILARFLLWLCTYAGGPSHLCWVGMVLALVRSGHLTSHKRPLIYPLCYNLVVACVGGWCYTGGTEQLETQHD